MDRARVEALLTTVETLIGCIRGELAEEPEPLESGGIACPHCGEADSDKRQDTTAMGENPEKRWTCLSCGKSWRPVNARC